VFPSPLINQNSRKPCTPLDLDLRHFLGRLNLVLRSGSLHLGRRLVTDKDAYPRIELLTGTVTDVLPDPAGHSRLSAVVVRTESGLHEIPAALVAGQSRN
jgi:hypothetical protein